MSDSQFPNVSALIDSSPQGDAECRDQLFALCRSYLGIVARSQVETWLRAKVDASDLVQETMLEAFRDFERFGGNSEQEWLAWLRRILAHNVADFVRRYRGTAKRPARREVPIRSPQDSTHAFGAAEPAAPAAYPQPGIPANRYRTPRRHGLGPACPPTTRRSSCCGTFSGCRSTKWPSAWTVPVPPCRCSGCGR